MVVIYAALLQGNFIVILGALVFTFFWHQIALVTSVKRMKNIRHAKTFALSRSLPPYSGRQTPISQRDA